MFKCEFIKLLRLSSDPLSVQGLNFLFWTIYLGDNFAQKNVEELPGLVVEATPRPPAENVNVFKSPFYQEKELLSQFLQRITYISTYQVHETYL